MTLEEKEAQEEQELIDAMMADLEEPEGQEEQEEDIEVEEVDGSDDNEADAEEHEESEQEQEQEVDEIEEDEEEVVEDTTDSFEPITVNVNGYDVEITSKEDMMAYIKKGADSFNKQPDKYTVEKDIVEQGKLSPEDLKLLVDAKNGSPEAIAKLAEIAKVDVYDIDTEVAKEYKPQFEPTVQSEIDIAANEILADESHANEFRQITNTLPQDFTEAVFSDANVMRNFSRHIKEGLAQKVIPQAINAQIRDGGSFMEHYSRIGEAMVRQAQQPKREVGQKEKELRKKASARASVSSEGTPRTDTADAIWDLTDAEFIEKYGE